MTSIIAALITMLTVLSKYWIAGLIIFGIVVIILFMNTGESHVSSQEDNRKENQYLPDPYRSARDEQPVRQHPESAEQPVCLHPESAEQLVRSTKSYEDVMGDYKSSVFVNSVDELYRYIAEPTFIRTISEARLIGLLNGDLIPRARNNIEIGMYKMEGHFLYTTILYKEERR